MVAFNITFKDADGNIVQPADGKTVKVTFANGTNSNMTSGKEISIYHAGDNGLEQLASKTVSESGRSSSISVQAKSFSPYVEVSRGSSQEAIKKNVLRIPVNGLPVAIDTAITKLQVLDPDKKPATELTYSSGFYLDMDWETKTDQIVHSGDYFDVTIPNTINLNNSETVKNFDLTNADGTVVAHATVTANSLSAESGGGTIHVVFNENADNRYNVKGTLTLYAFFNQEKVKENTTVPIQMEVNGKTSDTPGSPSIVIKPNPQIHETLGKWGSKTDDPNVVLWRMRINQQKLNLNNLVINDSLTSGNGTIIQNDPSKPIMLQEVEYDGAAAISKVIGNVDLAGKLVVSSDGNSFTLNLGNSGTKQYWLTYYTTKTNSDPQTNHAELSADNVQTVIKNITYKEKGGGGTAGGDLANKIKLTKVDADNNSVLLAGAVFTVTRPDGSTFELTTGADGTVTSGLLTQGSYKVREKTAPAGYKLNNEEYTLQVNSSGGALRTIKDEPARTSVCVNKKWIGTTGDAVTVHLYADGTDTGKVVTLNASNSWKNAFGNLRKYSASGSQIKYTVKEDVPAGYEGKITGSQENGYTITNTNVEKMSIPITKTWVGKAGDAVTVKLLADKKDTGKTVTLNADNQWKGNFTDLVKYDSTDGHEINYTIEEVKVDGYNSVISGTAGTGFTITNTITGKVSIPVTKTWVGKTGTSATIHLYADGAEVDSTTLNTGNNWQYTFSNLEKYNNGKEIQYTIKEDAIENYKSEITGNMTSGFTVKNTNTEKISIPVTKKWVGKEAPSATIKLLADGKEKDSVTLTKNDDWTHTFKDLPKYDETDGHEIDYTLDEVKVDGYNTGMTGTAETGFTITNTITGKVSVPVTKTWVGKAGDSAKIHLYADGKEVNSITLNQANN